MSTEINNADTYSYLANLSEEILTAADIETLLDRIITGVTKMVGCSQATLMLFEYRTHKLASKRLRGLDERRYVEPRIELTENVARWIYEGGEVLALAEENSDKFLVIFDQQEKEYFPCELRLPFYVGGVLVGVLSLGKKDDGTDYGPEDIDILRVITAQAMMNLEKFITPHESARDLPTPASKQSEPSKPKIKVKRSAEGHQLLGDSEAMRKVRDLIDRVAGKDVSVLITGESGTGKELVARAIHMQSSRRERPMVTMNSAALPETLVESELFGHEKGAFTGAIARKPGKFEVAHESTLFLDEIGDMSPATQAKLLRVLEDGTFQRIGGNSTLWSDVRLIAATNRDLRRGISEGQFREDLYYRINVVHINIPPLRERKEDIPALAEFFLHKFNSFYDKDIDCIEKDAMIRLVHYEFPGNVRELQNIIERSVIMEKGTSLALNLIPLSPAEGKSLVEGMEEITLEELERHYIEKTIKKAQFNKSHAARVLGIARKTLREKMEKYGIQEVRS